MEEQPFPRSFEDFPEAAAPNYWNASDGTRFAWNEYGESAGMPVFYYHGWPSSRWQARLTHRLGLEHRLRMIAMDRPGMGRSDFVPGRRLEDWPCWMEQFADHLEIERFGQLGVSGGGPYVIACAAMIPHRLIRSAVLCGAVALDRAAGGTHGLHPLYRLFALLRKFPEALWSTVLAIAAWGSSGDPRKFPFPLLIRSLPETDRRVLTAHPETLPFFIESFREGALQGGRGVMADAEIYFQPWPFEFEGIEHPIHFWHGGKDRNIPLFRVEEMVGKIAGSTVHTEPELGHFSLALLRADVAMAYLAQSTRGEINHR